MKSLYQKLISPVITLIILACLITLSIDPLMTFVLCLTVVVNIWLTILVTLTHYRESKTVNQITVYSHQELRYYVGEATVVFNGTFNCYYDRVLQDLKKMELIYGS